ncbi:hypothetical protein WICPIJ_002378 [Wickerhamomyces pijperi]|uniref:Anamorsin C-terminal domain-containing protein n=1 Tax=Wickerhamomyces pijperi TaxID=599730 RepID=A0A9P8TP01_WICPI|nr:hypothetical protein WICPIJ_002378 [Wickerhamomyces pijperi]
MSNVLLILNDKFVTLPEAEAIVITRKQTIAANHPGSTIDQFVLSNIVLGNFSLKSDHYDFIYFIDFNGEFNLSIPSHESIKNSLKTSQEITLNRRTNASSSVSKIGSKLSKLRFKKLAKETTPPPQASATSEVDAIQIDSPSSSLPELSSPATAPLNREDKLRFFEEDSDEEDIIDENELIGNSLLNTGSIICLREPNSGGKKRRKACKDCTCGLAEREAFGFGEEQEEEKQKKQDPPKRIQFSTQDLSEIDFTIEGKVGGCGSCSLGDAFRCDGCPYLGLPAFKPGQIISLDGISDDL